MKLESEAMEIKIEVPEGVFDNQFPVADFVARMRELALLELVRAKRIHEHEAAEALGCTRWELVEKMKAAGISPTEDLFAEIRGGLVDAIEARRPTIKRKDN
jgi:DNA-binding NtrC family response regulator